MNPEGTALAKRAVYADAPAMHLGDVFDDGKPQSGASHFAAAITIHPIKPFEQAREVLLFDAASFIVHHHRNSSTI